MAMTDTTFDELLTQAQTEGVGAALESLAQQMRGEHKAHELFDLRLMQARHELKLPIIAPQALDELPEPLRNKMEESYLAACREVGHLLLAEGRLREAWMYLRPIGDKEEVAAAVAALPAEEHYEAIIEIALHEGVAPALGFQLVLEHYGICNAISLFDSDMQGRPRAQRQLAAALIVRHLHRDLLAALVNDITQQQGKPPTESTIAGLVADRDWLFANDNYHVDTTHLSSVVRFALLAEDKEVLRLAVDLTEYGRRLTPQFQYPGDEPFTDTYPASALFFRAQLGQDVDEALRVFAERAASRPVDEAGTYPAEVYIALLVRLGRYGEALDAAARLLPAGVRTTDFAPGLLELARMGGEYERLMQICRERGDVVGFTAALLQQGQSLAAQ
jgi:hypothetical protein